MPKGKRGVLLDHQVKFVLRKIILRKMIRKSFHFYFFEYKGVGKGLQFAGFLLL